MSKRLGLQLFRIKKRELSEVLSEVGILIAHSRSLLNELEGLANDFEQSDEEFITA